MLKRTTRAKLKRLESGEYICQAPLGYINLPPSKHTKERYRKVEEVAEKVKKLLEMYSTERFTLMEMIDHAKKIGLPSKQGKEIKYSAMRQILTHRFYCGQWNYTDKETGKVLYSGTANGQWEPLVSKEIIEENIKILEGQTGPSKKRRGFDFRFRGLMVCGNCGRAILGEVGGMTVKKKSYLKTYYHCHRSPYLNKKTGKKVTCPMPFFSEDLIEEEIVRHLDWLQFDEAEWDNMKRSLFDFEVKDILKLEQTTLRAERTKLESRLEWLLDQKLKNKKDDIYQEKKPEWEKCVFKIRDELEILDQQMDNWNENVGRMIEVVDSLKDFKSKWLSFTPKKTDNKILQAEMKEKQRHMLQLITKRIETYAYTGALIKSKFPGSEKPIVNKLHSRQLNFVWSEEFQILFEMGIIKKMGNEAKDFVDKKNNVSATGDRQHIVNKKNKLSTIQQKLDFLLSIN